MMQINSHFLTRRMVLVLLPVLTSAIGRAQQPVSAEGSVRAIFRSHQKWLFAYTGRLPLDPLEIWNQHPATVDMDGDRVTLHVTTPYSGTRWVYPLQVQAAGFTFNRAGVGEFSMRLDAADANAPFKGRVGEMTVWLLRAQ